MSLFNFGRAMDTDSRSGKRAEELRAEAQGFDLAQTGGFLSVVKYLVFAVLACLNFHLFYTHVPGGWGIALGSVALLFEACTIYFWNKQNKSAGAHKQALQGFAVLFTAISFTHGCAALYQIGGVGPSMENAIFNYSKYVAFPLLFGLMVLAVCVLHYLHWSTRISESRAETLLRAEQGRAELITAALDFEHQAEIERSRLAFFEESLIQEEKYVQAVERFAAVKARGRRVIDGITDTDVRQELLNSMGMTATPQVAQRRINPLPAATIDPKDKASTE
jgi:hypothetical protein